MAKRHFAGAYVYREYPEPSVLMQGYIGLDRKFPRSYGRVQMKFPGGTNEEFPRVWDPRKTLRRELREELWMNLRNGVNPYQLCKVGGVSIDMYFFFIKFRDLDGELRNREINDGKTRLLVPEWLTLDQASAVVFPTHRPAVIPATKHISLMS